MTISNTPFRVRPSNQYGTVGFTSSPAGTQIAAAAVGGDAVEQLRYSPTGAPLGALEGEGAFQLRVSSPSTADAILRDVALTVGRLALDRRASTDPLVATAIAVMATVASGPTATQIGIMLGTGSASRAAAALGLLGLLIDVPALLAVATYTAGSPATLKLAGIAPATLKSAVDAYNAGTGAAPSLQVISTGTIVNAPVTVTAYADSGGQTTLTLGTLPSGFVAPTVGDGLFAYGP